VPVSHEALEGLLACPRCDALLRPVPEGWACTPCQVGFPDLGGVPFLFAEPGAAVGEWQARLNFELRRLQHDADRVALELKHDGLLANTRRRLEHLQAGYATQQQGLRELLAPLLAAAPPAARETYLALRTRLPSDQGLTTYAANVYRDWSWGDVENARATELVANLIHGETARLLVLGAGAGRLAWDLHRRPDPGLTIGLDFNPMLALLATRIADGGSLRLVEFPLAPRQLADCAVTRELRAPAATAPGLHWIIGDALRPPLVAASIDTIVTPWLVDILPADLADLARIVNRCLRPGGAWINFGALAFSGPEFATRYSLDEIVELLAAAGFEVREMREDELPYLCSPASRHARREQVVTWRAIKQRDVHPATRHAALPEWLVTGREAVPALPAFQLQAASTRVHAFVMSLIDGQRSIRDMAKLMEDQRLMTRQEAEPVIRDFLIRMFDEARGPRG
jgi:hypothetical protein